MFPRVRLNPPGECERKGWVGTVVPAPNPWQECPGMVWVVFDELPDLNDSEIIKASRGSWLLRGGAIHIPKAVLQIIEN